MENMEKEKKSTGKVVAIIILIVLLLGAVGYIGYDKLFVKETSDISKQNVNQNRKSTGKKELDINSRLVQTLYHKVTSDYKESWVNFWRYTKFGDSYVEENHALSDFNINTTSEEVKMQLVSMNLKDDEKQYIDCSTTSIPPEKSSGYSICYFNEKIYNNPNKSEYGYSKSYIESVYRDLYGSNANLDTSVIIYLDLYGVEKLVYIDTLDMYVLYTIEGGGTSGPGGYSTKISKAIKNGDDIKIYQEVVKTEYKEVNGVIDTNNEESKTTSNYTLVYTFKLDSDGLYNFVSREKEG